jgi:hypothetical protein
VDPCTWSIIVTAAAVVLPLVLLMVTVMLLAVASLVLPARRQRYLLAVLDRLVKIATALRGSSGSFRRLWSCHTRWRHVR